MQITRLTHGLETTIHYITHYDAVRNAKKILNDTGLRAELERKAGVKYARLLDAWVGSIASNNQDMARLTDIETLGEKLIPVMSPGLIRISCLAFPFYFLINGW